MIQQYAHPSTSMLYSEYSIQLLMNEGRCVWFATDSWQPQEALKLYTCFRSCNEWTWRRAFFFFLLEFLSTNKIWVNLSVKRLTFTVRWPFTEPPCLWILHMSFRGQEHMHLDANIFGGLSEGPTVSWKTLRYPQQANSTCEKCCKIPVA